MAHAPTAGRHLLRTTGLTLTLLGVVVASLWVWFGSSLTFFGEPLHRDDFACMTAGFVIGAALLVLVIPAVRLLGGGAGLVLLALLLAAACGVGALESYGTMQQTPAGEYPESIWSVPPLFAMCPTCWPALVMVVMTPWLRGRSRRERRAPLAPSSAPGRPRST